MAKKTGKTKAEKRSIGPLHKTHLWAIVLIFCTTALTSTAQSLYKLGVGRLEFNLLSIITNWPIIVGGCIYIIACAMMVIALKGGEVSVLYPIIATSYIWVSLMSIFFFHETMSLLKWAGVAVIFFGVITIALGSKDHSVEGVI